MAGGGPSLPAAHEANTPACQPQGWRTEEQSGGTNSNGGMKEGRALKTRGKYPPASPALNGRVE